MGRKVFKIMIVGGSTVGKNSLMKAACEVFEGKITTDSKKNSSVAKIPIDFDDTQYELVLSPFYDTGLTDGDIQQVQKADGFIVIFDLTNRFSLDRVQVYKKKIEKSTVKPALILVGNKTDLKNDREVKTEDALKLSDEFGCAYFEVSSQPNYKGVEDAFKEMVRVIEKQRKNNKTDSGCITM